MKNITPRTKHIPQGGFTLIEILIVIGIIAILAAIVLVAVNPAKQFEDANNAQRSSNVNAILNAIGQYMVDNQGALPSGIPSGTSVTDAEEISTSDTAGLCDDLIPEYIAALPADPDQTDDQSITEDECEDTGKDTDYMIYEEDGRVTIIAPNTQGGGDNISVTR